MTVVTRREHNLAPFVRRIRDSINNQFQGITTNGLLLRSVPLGVVTVAYPVVAPAGTVAFINVSETTVNVAGVPLSETSVVPMKPWPRMPPTWPIFPEGRTNATNGPAPISRLNAVPQPINPHTMPPPEVNP